MSLPRRQAPKIKKICKQYGIDFKIIENNLDE
jgi:hypothetical protein